MPILTASSIQATIDKANGILNRVNTLLAQTLTPEVEDALTDLAQYLNQLIAELTGIRNEMVAVLSAALTSPLPWIRDERILPRNDECFTPFLDETNNILHPAQLTGWDLAEYIKCIIGLDRARWVGSQLSGAADWNRNMKELLPDLNLSTTIIGIDPFNPQPFTQNYTELPLVEGLWLPSTTDSLPFLPSSVITRPDLGRRALAQATWDLWTAIGIFQNLKI